MWFASKKDAEESWPLASRDAFPREKLGQFTLDPVSDANVVTSVTTDYDGRIFEHCHSLHVNRVLMRIEEPAALITSSPQSQRPSDNSSNRPTTPMGVGPDDKARE